MRLTRLIFLTGIFPFVALIVATSWMLFSVSNQASNAALTTYGEGLVAATAAALPADISTANEVAVRQHLTRLLEATPAIVAVSIHDASGARLLAEPPITTATRLSPFVAELWRESPATSTGQVRIFLDPSAALPGSATAPAGRELLLAAWAAVVLVISLSMAMAARRIVKSIGGSIRRIADETSAPGFDETTLAADPDLSAAVNDLRERLSNQAAEQQEKHALKTQAIEEQVASLQAREQEVRLLFSRVNEEVEKERRTIAVDIHDQFNASAIAIRNAAQMIGEMCQEDAARGTDPVTHQRLEQVALHARQIALETDQIYTRARDMVKNLRPELIDVLGLAASIKQLLRQFGDHHPRCSIRFEECADVSWLTSDKALTVYRIVQESLNNVAKHSGASSLYVSIADSDDGSVTNISVTDNGCGFQAVSKGNTSLGLVGMRERAIGMGAQIEIQSVKGTGTTLTIAVPKVPASAST